MTTPLLLLAAPSRESRDKAAHFSAAATALGIPARVLVADRSEQIMINDAARGHYIFVLACSDALAEAAAMLNARCGVAALAAPLAARLVDKASGIPLLSDLLDLPLLPQMVPRTAAELLAWSYVGPVIAKPACSAGGWSPRPWGYRCFDHAAALFDWLEAEGLTKAFFAEQCRPGPLGPVVLQAAVDGDRIEGAAMLLTAGAGTVYARCHAEFEVETQSGQGRRWWRATYHAAAASILAERLPRLARLIGRVPGWNRGLLHVQGIVTPGGFCLTDINQRLPTPWDWLIAQVDPSFHRRLLASLLFDEPFDPVWPAPAMAIDLVYGPSGRAIKRIDHPPPGDGVMPWRLDAADCAVPRHGFDKAGQAPGFITLGGNAEECARRAEAFRAGLDITYALEQAA
ncbi:hypothetical protein [Ferrovibrio sp.]|uniref:hypothetical protein n=1 Tax=Ferrovibrio sp. TaxID=1917215 RepID=UPI0026090A70|nr:hypothetical protein [Ferrovibrio sp.]